MASQPAGRSSIGTQKWECKPPPESGPRCETAEVGGGKALHAFQPDNRPEAVGLVWAAQAKHDSGTDESIFNQPHAGEPVEYLMALFFDDYLPITVSYHRLQGEAPGPIVPAQHEPDVPQGGSPIVGLSPPGSPAPLTNSFPHRSSALRLSLTPVTHHCLPMRGGGLNRENMAGKERGWESKKASERNRMS